MKIIFLASSSFAVPSLRAILDERHSVCCVVTQPDKKKGRGLHLEGTAVKQVCVQNRLDVFQPEAINAPRSVEFLKRLQADLFVVVAYGQILSQDLLDIPKIFAVNLHASFLPKYRGAAPINWTLINGEKETGVTVIKMIKKMDAGPVILQRQVSIERDETEITLQDKLSTLGAQVLVESLRMIEEKRFSLQGQVESKVSLAPKLTKHDGLLTWQHSAQQLDNLIRGCIGWPGAYTYYKGKLLKVFRAEVMPYKTTAACGEILWVSKEGIAVATGSGALVVKELQLEGRRRMNSEEFISGHRAFAGELLGKK